MEMTTEELETWKRLNECEAVKQAWKQWYLLDMYVHDGAVAVIIDDIMGHYLPDDYYWMPDLFDPIRPERSLWHLSGDIRWHWSVSEKLQFTFDARPDLALAQAIILNDGEGMT